MTFCRLHVHIYDTAQKQHTISENLIPRPGPSGEDFTPDLVFNFESYPFEFWITRRSDSEETAPLFDTRVSSLPRPADKISNIARQVPSWISYFYKTGQRILGLNPDRKHTPVTFDSPALIFQERFLQVSRILQGSRAILTQNRSPLLFPPQLIYTVWVK